MSKTKWTTTPKDAEFSINKCSAGLSQWCKQTLKELDSLSRKARSTKQQQDWEARLPCPGGLPCDSISADFRRASAQRRSLHSSDSLSEGALEAFKENTLNNNKKILWHIKNWAEGPSVKMDKSRLVSPAEWEAASLSKTCVQVLTAGALHCHLALGSVPFSSIVRSLKSHWPFTYLFHKSWDFRGWLSVFCSAMLFSRWIASDVLSSGSGEANIILFLFPKKVLS